MRPITRQYPPMGPFFISHSLLPFSSTISSRIYLISFDLLSGICHSIHNHPHFVYDLPGFFPWPYGQLFHLFGHLSLYRNDPSVKERYHGMTCFNCCSNLLALPLSLFHQAIGAIHSSLQLC